MLCWLSFPFIEIANMLKTFFMQQNLLNLICKNENYVSNNCNTHIKLNVIKISWFHYGTSIQIPLILVSEILTLLKNTNWDEKQIPQLQPSMNNEDDEEQSTTIYTCSIFVIGST